MRRIASLTQTVVVAMLLGGPVSLSQTVHSGAQTPGELIEKARALEKAGDDESAAATWQQLADLDPTQRYRYAQFLSSRQRTAEALEQFRRHCADNPRDDRALAQTAQLLAEMGRMDEAIEYAEKSLVSGQVLSLDYLWEMLRLWDKAGGLARARERYSRLARNEDRSAEVVVAHLLLGEIAYAQRDVAAAQGYYRTALQKISPPADRWQESVYRGVLDRIYLARDWLSDAVVAYRNWPDEDLLLRLGERLRSQGRGFEMLSLYRDYLVLGPREHTDRMPGYVSYGRRDIARAVIDEIISVGEGGPLVEALKAAAAGPQARPDLRRHLACLLFRLQRSEEGLREVQGWFAGKEKPLAVDYEWAGKLCEEGGLIDDAVRYYEKALSTEITAEDLRQELPSQRAAPGTGRKAEIRTRILRALVSLDRKQERWADAERHLKEIVDSGQVPSVEYAKGELADVWKRMGKENAFLEDLRARVAAEPNNLALRTTYAGMLLRAKEAREAVEQYRQAVKLSPGDLSLRLQLARALAENKQSDEAVDRYKEMLFIACQKPESEFRRGKVGDETTPERVLFELAALCHRLGREDNLLEVYGQILESVKLSQMSWQPEPHELERILRDAAEIHEREGRPSEAARLWLTYRKLAGENARRAIRDRRAQLGPLPPLIEKFREETGSDPNDQWGRFILGDLLTAEDRPQEARDVYTNLLSEVAPDGPFHQALCLLFDEMGRDDLLLLAYEKELAALKKGSWEYAQKLGQMAALCLQSGDQAKAAQLYREAAGYVPSELQYQYGLFDATGGKEGRARAAVEAVEDLKARRARAEALLYSDKDFAAAAQLYQQILQEAPTDVRSMACLGWACEQAGRTQEAIAWYEKAHRMRSWAWGQDGDAAHRLQQIYRQTGADEKLLSLLTEQHNYHDVRDYYESRGEPEKFERYALEQMKHKQDTWLRIYLGLYYLDHGNREGAAWVYEALRSDLVNSQDKTPDATLVLDVARGFERLGRLEEALAVAAGVDYERELDGSDWFGELLTRLYAGTGQFDRASDIWVLRLKKHPQESRTPELAKQMVEQAKGHPEGGRWVNSVLEKAKGQIPEEQYERFRGAVMSCLAAYGLLPEGAQRDEQGRDALTLLTEGRSVVVPQDCRNFAQFLGKLASQADTVATQSFMMMSGVRLKPPHTDMTSASAFEVLADVLNGTGIHMEIDQEGHWAFFESADANQRTYYAASGGLLCRTDGFNRRADRPYPWLLGRVLFEPRVQANVASIQSLFEVIEAVDDQGRAVPVPPVAGRWDASGQIEVHLAKLDPPAGCMAKVRVRTAVVVATKWASFTIDRLDHREPITRTDQGVRITVSPIMRSNEQATSRLEIPIAVEQIAEPGPRGIGELKMVIDLTTADGQRCPAGFSTTRPEKNRLDINVHVPTASFEPAATSLTIRLPAAVETVPFELVFRNVPIIDQQPRALPRLSGG